MTFAIKGGGVSSAIGGFQQKIVWKPVKILPWLLKRVLHIIWTLYYIYVVVEVTSAYKS